MQNKTVNQQEGLIWYEIRQGAKNMMYTLWYCGSKFMRDNFVTNLSIDKDTAIAKAEALAGSMDLIDCSWGNLKPIYYSKVDCVNFGKYKGTKLEDLPDDYLCWIAEGAQIKVKTDRFGNKLAEERQYTKHLVGYEQRDYALEIAKNKGLFVDVKGKLIPKRLADYITKQNERFGLYFKDNERLELTVRIVHIGTFNNQFGGGVIYVLEDQEGRLFKYKGSNYLRKPWTNQQYIDYFGSPKAELLEEGYVERYNTAEIGDGFRIKATITHTEYAGSKVTYLKRPKSIFVE